MKNLFSSFEKYTRVASLILLTFFFVSSVSGQLLKVGVAGLKHDHVNGILNDYKKGRVIILGIAEADEQLVQRYKKNYQLPDSLFYKDLNTMLAHIKPDAVLAFNPIAEHIAVVET